MRSMTGWRFIVAIAVPLVLASAGTIGLSFDLLTKVESSGNMAERHRNRQVLAEALRGEEAALGHRVLDNAKWDIAAAKTAPNVDRMWFAQTWGSPMSLGVSYDLVAVIDSGTGQLAASASVNSAWPQGQQLFERTHFASFLKERMGGRDATGAASGFAMTPAGPALIAMAPIVDPRHNNIPNGRLLVFGRLLDETYVSSLERRFLLSGIELQPQVQGANAGLPLADISGQQAWALTWQDKDVGSMLTGTAWTKASAVLGFLILVMTGIGIVCWRLVQQLVRNEEVASHNALHDHLTGLPNRMALVEEMRAAGSEGNTPYTLAFADLDGFKDVNDSYGHEFGDRLLNMVSAGILQLAHHARLCSRMGGDEFVVMFTGPASEADARRFAGQLIQLLNQPFDMDGRMAAVGASIGIAHNPGALDETEILRRADIAMYKAKEEGKNRFRVYDKRFDLEREENLAIANELKGIIAGRMLDVLFQPVVSARTGAISGVEALSRWPQSSARKVTADRFIPVAEKAGLIDDLGELMLDKACEAARAWPALRLAVNISAVQLNNPHFIERSLAILQRHGIAPNRLEFEITETSLIHDTERAKQVFTALQRVGIKVALDDFGTGFSSIGYLRTFNFDRIKIDKSIVSKVLSSAAELAIVQGTLLVARGLSADVTAEGVERPEEVSVLRLAGCTELQGYHFHKPMRADEISQLLAQSKTAPVPRSIMVG